MLDFAVTTVVPPRFSALRMQARRISVPSSPRHVRTPVRHNIASLRSVAVTVAKPNAFQSCPSRSGASSARIDGERRQWQQDRQALQEQLEALDREKEKVRAKSKGHELRTR